MGVTSSSTAARVLASLTLVVAMLALSAAPARDATALAPDEILSFSGNNCLSFIQFNSFGDAAGKTITIAATLPADLSPFAGIVLNSCSIVFDASQEAALQAYVDAGGILFLIADGWVGRSASWPVMNDLATALGVTMQLQATVGGGTCQTSQIDAHPLTFGVSTVEYWLVAELQVTGSAFSLMRTDSTCAGHDDVTTWLGGQNVGNGLVLYSTDENAFRDDLLAYPRAADNSDTSCFVANVFGNTIADCAAPNTPPTADAGGPYGGDEGASIALNGASATDGDGDALTFSWTVDTSPTSATCSFSDATVLQPDLTCDDNGTFTVTLTVDDGTAAPVGDDATVAVANVDPEVGAVTVPTDPVAIDDQPVTGVSAPYTDDGSNDTHTCTVDYGDGTGPQAGTTDGSTCDGPGHTYSAAGVYTVTVEVTDDDTGSGSATAAAFVVIYDASAGFVTGGGWIDSPAGAYVADPALTGKANFGFVSKYKKGASTPTGQTEFQFKAGDLNFHSGSYDWLVIAGQDKAKYKGTGTINGAGNYGFMLTAVDNGNSGDTFRIKIWDKDNGDAVVYDNQISSGDDSYDGTVIGGGNIRVHQKN